MAQATEWTDVIPSMPGWYAVRRSVDDVASQRQVYVLEPEIVIVNGRPRAPEFLQEDLRYRVWSTAPIEAGSAD